MRARPTLVIPDLIRDPRPAFPKPLQALAVLFLLASLAHFIHNAEYIAYYPGMPGWLTREKVYLFWLAFASPGLLALICARLHRPRLALVFLAVYGALGLDALGHYALALCSEHTLIANVTIWAEAVTGLVLCVASVVVLGRRLHALPQSLKGT